MNKRPSSIGLFKRAVVVAALGFVAASCSDPATTTDGSDVSTDDASSSDSVVSADSADDNDSDDDTTAESSADQVTTEQQTSEPSEPQESTTETSTSDSSTTESSTTESTEDSSTSSSSTTESTVTCSTGDYQVTIPAGWQSATAPGAECSIFATVPIDSIECDCTFGLTVTTYTGQTAADRIESLSSSAESTPTTESAVEGAATLVTGEWGLSELQTGETGLSEQRYIYVFDSGENAVEVSATSFQDSGGNDNFTNRKAAADELAASLVLL